MTEDQRHHLPANTKSRRLAAGFRIAIDLALLGLAACAREPADDPALNSRLGTNGGKRQPHTQEKCP